MEEEAVRSLSHIEQLKFFPNKSSNIFLVTQITHAHHSKTQTSESSVKKKKKSPEISMLSTQKNFRDLHICRCACPINTCASSFNTVRNTHAYKSLPTHRLRNRANLNKWTQNGTWILLNILKKTIQHYLTPDNLKILVFSFQMEAASTGKNG